MTKGALRDRVASKIGMSGSAELTLLEGWVDEAIEQYMVETKAIVREGVMTMTNGVTDYLIPIANILSFSKVWVVPAAPNDSQYVELEQLSSSAMLQKRRYVYTGDHPRSYELLGMDLIRVFPTPDGTETMHILYVPTPPPLANTDDLTLAGVVLPDHPICEEYVSWKAADWDDDTSSKIGMAYQQNWEVGIRKAKRRRNLLDNGWGPAKPGRARWIPPKPGTDIGW